jgi:hypothetical protein
MVSAAQNSMNHGTVRNENRLGQVYGCGLRRRVHTSSDQAFVRG